VSALFAIVGDETFSGDSVEELAPEVAAELSLVDAEGATVYDEQGFIRGWINASGAWRAQ
jgi:hypothetical protein